MLVDHADAVGVRLARIVDLDLPAVDDHLAARRLVEAHDAFDEGRLAGAVLAEEGVQGARLHLDRHVLERDQRTEDLGHADRLEADRAVTGMRRRRRGSRTKGNSAHRTSSRETITAA